MKKRFYPISALRYFQEIKLCYAGKSGSGKSSVLRTLLGLHPLTLGTVYFQEKPLTPTSVQTIRSCTAYIGQEPILGAESVREALLLPFQFKTHRDHRPTQAQLIEVLQRLQLPEDILNQGQQPYFRRRKTAYCAGSWAVVGQKTVSAGRGNQRTGRGKQTSRVRCFLRSTSDCSFGSSRP